ncbi:unnamed protein product [Linum trigynum]|uniref:RNase H type-1 domain-containing protein n=1 Tax=Linum trigynum TaxID=586398 RepID=A0AAV2FUA6_9ROSI
MEEEQVISRAIAWLRSYLDAQDNAHSGPSACPPTTARIQIRRWIPPSEGIFKMNTDVGVSSNSGIDLGCIMRDWKGDFCGAMARKERGVCRPIEAEAKAILMGLKEANRRQLSPVIVESDCQLLLEN